MKSQKLDAHAGRGLGGERGVDPVEKGEGLREEREEEDVGSRTDFLSLDLSPSLDLSLFLTSRFCAFIFGPSSS